MKRFSGLLVGVVALALLAVSQVQAAVMTWEGIGQISGDSDVLTNGTLVGAYSIGNASSTTVNGVTFQAFPVVNDAVTGWANPLTASHAVITSDPFLSTPPSGGLKVNYFVDGGDATGDGGAFAGLSSSYKQLLGHSAMSKGLQWDAAWNTVADWLPAPAAVTLTGLTPGNMYLFQNWQQNYTRSWMLTSGGATSDVIAGGDGVTAGSLGQYIIGTFIADSTGSQRIDWLANAPDNWEYNILNAFQVREVPVPVVVPVQWTGIGSTTWSTATGQNNWKDSEGTAADYVNSAPVTFDDTATGTSVNVSMANVLPASVTFDNSSKDFSITGAKGIGGATGVVKQGTGTVTLSNANTYTGATTVNAGTLALAYHGDPAGGALSYTSGVTINSSATLRIDNYNALGGYPDPLTADATLTPAVTVNDGGLLTMAAGYNCTLSALNLNGGSVTSVGSGDPDGWGSWNLRGNVAVGGGAISTLASDNMTLDRTGGVTFTVDSGSTLDVTGGFVATTHGTGLASLTKAGDGKMILRGANSYTGATTLQAGTLQMAESAYTNVVTNGGADIQGGKGVLDYSASGVSPASEVQAALAASYHDGAWDLGQIRNTTAGTTGLTLGWANDTTAKQVTIMATYSGDADLSGTVNVADLTNLLNNYNNASMVWANGDFNYDNLVNVADLTALLNNYNKTIGGSVVAGTGLSMGSGAVPEPGTCALLAAGLISLLAYAWRKQK